MLDWKLIFTSAILTLATVSGLAVYFFKDEKKGKQKQDDAVSQTASSDSVQKQQNALASKEELLEMLATVSSMQEKQKELMKSVIKSFKNDKKSFDSAYNEIKSKSNNLANDARLMERIDATIHYYQDDPVVSAMMSSLLGGFGDPATMARVEESITEEKLIAIHKSMNTYFDEVVGDVKALRARPDFDVGHAIYTYQAYVSARIEEEYGVTYDELEAALIQRPELAQNHQFMTASVDLQNKLCSALSPETSDGSTHPFYIRNTLDGVERGV